MPILLLVVFLNLIGPFGSADETRLIRAGSIWKYLKGTNEPALPVGVWRFPEYDDTAWPSSMSGFSTIAYAPEPAYLTDYGFNYRTLYLRKRFSVGNPGSLAQLIFRVEYDDGFVAYLNGREVARRGASGELDEPLPVD